MKWHEIVKPLDIIELNIEDDDYHFTQIPFSNKVKVDILFEDEHLIIVNKPENLKTHGNQPNEIALQNYVSGAINQQVFIVHRLDMATSGTVLFAKNPFILPILSRLLEQKKINRQYLALVEGDINQPLTISKKIGRDRHDKRRRVIDEKNGQSAITHIVPIKKINRYTLVKCQLETGRTHQIRVHFESIGHPIIGDPLYHPKPNGRLMLHAEKLELVHPFSKKEIKIIATSKSYDTHINSLAK